MLRSLLVVALLCSPLVTQAHIFHENECQSLGFLIYQIGTYRDQGAPKAQVEDVLFKEIKDAINEPDAYIVDEHDIKLVEAIVIQLYEHPEITPLDAGKIIRDKCVTESYRDNT